MKKPTLGWLATAAGLDTYWKDFKGETHFVEKDALRAILAAMGLPAGTQADIAASAERLLDATSIKTTPLQTMVVGGPVQAWKRAGPKAELILEDGDRMVFDMSADDTGVLSFKAPNRPGYHTLFVDGRSLPLAIAPRRAWTVADLAPGRGLFGLAAQLYSLRGGDTPGFGDFAALAEFAENAAPFGVDAVAVSPVHAQFIADPGRYAPYSPSNRMFLNPLHAVPPPMNPSPALDNLGEGLIDWPRDGQRKRDVLRAAYAAFRGAGGDGRADFAAFVADGGKTLLSHARFEALDGRFRPQGVSHWRDWPGGYADCASPEVAALAADDPEIEFHLFLQWIADQSLSDAQRRARQAGMAIGLIADLAVGMDEAGSHAWSRPGEILRGVGIGAPPDLLAPNGQDWGLTAFSPMGLKASAFDGFLATLRAAMRNAGGVRIDHAMGLHRLWVIPDGATPDQGAYLEYPRYDLYRLLALESLRHRAVVVGEDLGTLPRRFAYESTEMGMFGMRVLWFERTSEGAFKPPEAWDAKALALTTTHDLPTIAGWWRGRDIDWCAKTGLSEPRVQSERESRAADRPLLWEALSGAGCVTGDMPSPEDDASVVDGAVAFIGKTPSLLAIMPMEDALGLDEQPNLPGTIDQHPNWRRRLPPGDPFDTPDAARRLRILARARQA